VTDLEIRGALSDVQVLALTCFAEARGDAKEGSSSVEERIAVGCVCRNRLRRPDRWGHSYREVCLAPKQFSCWNAGTDPNHVALMAVAYRMATGQPTMDPLLDETLFLADGIMRGVLLDRVNGAVSYYAPAAMKPPGRVPAAAVGKKTLPVGNQLFYDA